MGEPVRSNPSSGELRCHVHRTPVASPPSGESSALARAVGCPPSAVIRPEDGFRPEVRCAVARPAPLRMRAELRLGELAGTLREAGISRLDLTLTVPDTGFLRIEPPVPRLDSRFGSYLQATYDVDQLPAQLSIESGFENRQVWTLAAGVLGLLLLPVLLVVARPKNLVALSAGVQALFLTGWTGWTWVLMESHAGKLFDFVFRGLQFGPLLALAAPPLVAVWLASRVAASHSVRLSPSRGGRTCLPAPGILDGRLDRPGVFNHCSVS